LVSEAANSSNIRSFVMSRTCVASGHNVSVNGSGWAMHVSLDSSPSPG
jgi:hypothetical protein